MLFIPFSVNFFRRNFWVFDFVSLEFTITINKYSMPATANSSIIYLFRTNRCFTAQIKRFLCFIRASVAISFYFIQSNVNYEGKTNFMLSFESLHFLNFDFLSLKNVEISSFPFYDFHFNFNFFFIFPFFPLSKYFKRTKHYSRPNQNAPPKLPDRPFYGNTNRP